MRIIFLFYTILIKFSKKDGVQGIWKGNTFAIGWLDTDPLSFPRLDEAMLEPKEAHSLSPANTYCVAKGHILQEVSKLATVQT